MLTLRVKLPALVTVDLRIVAPHSVFSKATEAGFKYNDGVRFAPLPAIRAAKKKPLDVKTLAEVTGGAALTTALAQAYGCDEPAAEELKRSFGMGAARPAGVIW